MKEHLTEEQLFKIINRLDLPQFLEDDPPPIAEGYINRSWAKIDQGALSFHIGVTPLVIECIKPAVLIVNGERVGKATIEKDDVVDWCIDAPPLFDIRISSDQLSAYFKLNDKHRHEWLLVDYPSSDSLRLCAAERMDVILETLTMDTIGEEVDRLGIRGVDWAAIGRELDNPAFEPVLIATGTPCKPPKHASIELYFNEHIVSAYEEVNGTIDYRNHLKIPSAQKGQVVAKKHLLEEGLPGITVFGTLIQPEPARDLMMVAKDHIKINNQIEAVATAEGRPRITGDRIKFIDLTTAHVVPGDVDLKTGNIVFSGDIIIYGSVMDGMVVEALGNIYVYGHVFRATLSATGNVYLKGNAIGSHIYCGHYGVLFNRLYKGARALTESIRKLLEAFKQLGQAIGDKKRIRIRKATNSAINGIQVQRDSENRQRAAASHIEYSFN
ncbi:FapA family protein [Cohnella rhizosphaerae]|uniref:FapA family protein n=1 Tax=Cohnella rhizosphaerae TaxID=1457232 RepID=A0A9X4KVK5_9BACL|nr:FapA family protein [Cohnella rhizosphaerae]MDG0811223.1 FapA family protein [Cohnella rhizosphaerae]